MSDSSGDDCSLDCSDDDQNDIDVEHTSDDEDASNDEDGSMDEDASNDEDGSMDEDASNDEVGSNDEDGSNDKDGSMDEDASNDEDGSMDEDASNDEDGSNDEHDSNDEDASDYDSYIEYDSDNDCDYVSDGAAYDSDVDNGHYDEDEIVFDIKMKVVNMPSGAKVEITKPAKPCTHYNCDFGFYLILLRAENDFAQKERQMIVNEMVSTMRQHVQQERGGGRFSTYDIISVHKIQNNCLWKRFRDRKKQLAIETDDVNERMLFHGTTAADTIVKTGFDKKCAKPSGMFGGAIYFAENSSKSNQYAYGLMGGNGCPAHRNRNCYECHRKMLLCRVALGNMYRLTNANTMNGGLPPGYHSVAGVPGSGLQYPEYAVYNENQIYPEYLITYRIVR